MDNKSVFNTKEIARYLGISISTVYRMEKQGLITSIKTPGGQRRFIKEEMDRYLRNSLNIEAPQNPSKFKKVALKVADVQVDYALRKIITPEEKPFFYKDDIWIYNVDFLNTSIIPDNSIDLIVTSPPYNVDIHYNSHDDSISYPDYLLFTRKWLTKCLKALKPDGRFCLNIPLDKNKGGNQSVCADITSIANDVGFKYHSTIIWNEQNISRRTAWGSWMSAGAPYVIAPVEVILVLYKESWKKTSGSKISNITRKEFIEWTNGVWNFSGESKKRVGHPAPFPIELPKRCIKLFSFVGDTVLDPFLGSGSTLIACIQNERKGIGIDIDTKYCELAKKRLILEGNINQPKLQVIEGE